MKIWAVAVTILLVAWVLVATLCYGKPSTSGLTEVTFERSRCFGSCPAYRVTLHPSGTLVYVGEAFVQRIGTYTAKFSDYDFRRLSRLADDIDLWHMQDAYETAATDLPAEDLTLRAGDKVKKIHVYGADGPDKLWAFQMVVDAIVAGAQNWKKVQ